MNAPVGEIRAVKTNGIGKRSDFHLNRLISMAALIEQEGGPGEKWQDKNPGSDGARKPRPKGPFVLTDSSGLLFLDRSGVGMTRDRERAWCGTRHKLALLRSINPSLRSLKAVSA